jgi:hypothetical protein
MQFFWFAYAFLIGIAPVIAVPNPQAVSVRDVSLPAACPRRKVCKSNKDCSKHCECHPISRLCQAPMAA